MRTYKASLVKGVVLLFAAILVLMPSLSMTTESPSWHFNGTVIEACSCPMFCSCYFNPEPALHNTEHGTEHFCKFNMAYRVNKGHYGDTDLSGVMFWVAGDLGESWKDGETEWAVVTFKNGTTEEQKAGVATALTHIFPVSWKSFTVADDADISWEAGDDRAEAKLANGSNAHIILNKWQGMEGEMGVLSNIAYFGAARNDGFKMMPNEIETWKVGDKAFEFKGSTGFMVTVDMSSKDLAM